ncbi:hypothetical protein F4553_001282 [Allocatelliglobosispora scoriae]|uniref:Uncharacterized protein n=1 Tax=Allocatelliglobosispora scoriae TaxID=643052 RepID=A0A841BLQ3_9ACTN|nr:hypothetical protein [Allocatelliglobosispora scoriae]MBB5867903.1 hypothetical protein [Allocatelliglobosispora scoriae]
MQLDQSPSAPRPSFWTSFAGVLTAIAALLSALVAAGTLIYQVVGDDDAPVAAVDSAPASARPEADPATTAPDTSAPVEPVGGLPWTGPLTFDNSGVDFDVTPPSSRLSTGIDVYDGGGHIVAYGVGLKNVARWNQAAAPTARDCADLLRSHGVSQAAFDQGAVFCVRTRGAGRIVAVRFVKPVEGGYEIQATIWPAQE